MAESSIRSLWSWIPFRKVPEAEKLLDLCKETIRNATEQWSTKSAGENFLINRHQCELLVDRLSRAQERLAKIQRSELLDGSKIILVLQELHGSLLDAEALIKSSCLTDSNWPRAAMEQGDMKETFAKLFYEVEWCTDILLSSLMDNFKRPRAIASAPEDSDGRLSKEVEFDLLVAVKKDEECLRTQLSSVKVDDPIKQALADQLLKQMEGSSRLKLVELNPEGLDRNRGTILGQGAFGSVETTGLLGSQYAMKVIVMPDDFADMEDSLLRELEVIKVLGHHPHLVRLLCYSKNDKVYHLIMEKMQDNLMNHLSNLREKMQKDGDSNSDATIKKQLTMIQAVSLMLQIGEGVEYIHSQRVAHRDLKPQNILVNLEKSSSESEPPRISSVKIADFGLSKTTEASKTYSDQTGNTGTTEYMAPEVIRPPGDQSHKPKFNPRKADVYSFAIICSVILTRNRPHYDLINVPNQTVKTQVKQGSLRPTLPPDCPGRLATLIRKCWAGVPSKRPQFDEICRELRYIKGLLLRDDQEKLEIAEIETRPEGAKVPRKQGPWGGEFGRKKFFDMATSIKEITVYHNEGKHIGSVGPLKVKYELFGLSFDRTYCSGQCGQTKAEIIFKEHEYITRISGYTCPLVVKQSVTTCVVSLTIHTNIESYGPYGRKEGTAVFSSDEGEVIGFFGEAGKYLHSLGVVIIPGATLDSNSE